MPGNKPIGHKTQWLLLICNPLLTNECAKVERGCWGLLMSSLNKQWLRPRCTNGDASSPGGLCWLFVSSWAAAEGVMGKYVQSLAVAMWWRNATEHQGLLKKCPRLRFSSHTLVSKWQHHLLHSWFPVKHQTGPIKFGAISAKRCMVQNTQPRQIPVLLGQKLIGWHFLGHFQESDIFP